MGGEGGGGVAQYGKTVKYSIFKREAHSELYQKSKKELLQKCLVWYYEYTLESEYALCRFLNIPGVLKVLNMREYALE